MCASHSARRSLWHIAARSPHRMAVEVAVKPGASPFVASMFSGAIAGKTHSFSLCMSCLPSASHGRMMWSSILCARVTRVTVDLLCRTVVHCSHILIHQRDCGAAATAATCTRVLPGAAVDVSLFPLDTLKTRLQAAEGFWKVSLSCTCAKVHW